MLVNLGFDQFLKSDVIRKGRLRAIESNDPFEIRFKCGMCRWRIHIKIKQPQSLPEPMGLADKHLSQKLLMDLGGAFNDLHDLGITVIPGNRG